MTVRCGAGRCSSLPHQLPQRYYSFHHLPPHRSCCGPAPETSSHLSGESKQMHAEGHTQLPWGTGHHWILLGARGCPIRMKFPLPFPKAPHDAAGR